MSESLELINEVLGNQYESMEQIPIEELQHAYLLLQIAYILGRIEEETGEQVQIFCCNPEENGQ